MKTIINKQKNKLINRTLFCLLIFCIQPTVFCFSQGNIGINTTGATPDASAMLDIAATDHGILIPRLTSAQRNAIPSPSTGLLIYNTSTNLFNYYSGSEWYEIAVTYVSSTSGTLHPGKGISITAINSLPDSSAMLNISDTIRGLLVPRLTGAEEITSPSQGLIFYNTTTNRFNYYNGSGWVVPCVTATGVSGATGSLSIVGMAINTDGSAPDASAILDIQASNQGILIPRLTTTDRNNIKHVTGLSVYNITTNAIEYYNGSAWYMLEYNTPSVPSTGTHVPSATQIIWNWNTVPNATGYKWHTANIYSAATDMLTGTTKTETGLSCGTTYTRYVWAYNACGNSSETTLTKNTCACPVGCGIITDTRDGKTYPTVQIGTQCWMKQNVNYGTYVSSATGQTINGIQKYCYSNNTNYCNTYGGLYIWTEIMNGSSGCWGTGSTQPSCSTPVQGICPSGWHVPTTDEYILLQKNVGSCPSCFSYSFHEGEWITGLFGTDEGANLKSGGCSGFDALLTGDWENNRFDELGIRTGFWTSVVDENENPDQAFYFILHVSTDHLVNTIHPKIRGKSVRCVKDCGPGAAGTVTGQSSVCFGQSGATYSTTTISGATSYKWSYSGTGATINGTTNTVTVDFSITATSGNITVRGNNSCGDGPVSSGYVITLNTVPAACGSITNITDSRDGKTYGIVSIGTQCWMQQNLNYGTYVSVATGQTPAGIQKYCYGNNTDNCITYGGLYTWTELMNGSGSCNGTNSIFAACSTPVQGICPAGWHVPSHYEWTLMERSVRGACPGCFPFNETTANELGTNEGARLKSNGGSNFNALYGGFYMSGFFTSLGSYADFWTSTQSSSDAWNHYIYNISSQVGRSKDPKISGFSLRCIKDGATITGTATVCESQNGVLYSVPSVSDATSFTWSYSGNGITINGTTNRITVNFSSTATSGNLTVRSRNDCGDGEISLNYPITVNSAPISSVSGTHVSSQTQIIWTWNTVSGAIGYKWHISNNYAAATNMGAAITKTESSLICNTAYSRYVWAYNSCGNSSSIILTQSTTSYNSPSEGTHTPSRTQIIWRWNSVSGITGYKWHTSNVYSAATNIGTGISKTETGLTCSTSYSRYLWAYGACGNSSVTTLLQTSSACPDACNNITSMTDSRDNQTYSIVAIGAQCWMRKNLNYGTYVTTTTGQGGAGIQKYCYGNNSLNCNTYGGIYVWSEIMNGSASCNGTGASQPACSSPVKGICPSGWHISSHYEWTLLEKSSGGTCPGCFPYNEATTGELGSNEGVKLRSGGTSGFDALYAGYYYSGSFSSFGSYADFWTSTESSSNAWNHYVSTSNGRVGRYKDSKTNGFSVRCVKN